MHALISFEIELSKAFYLAVYGEKGRGIECVQYGASEGNGTSL